MNKSEIAKIVYSLNDIADLKNQVAGDYAKGSAAMATLLIDLLSKRVGSAAYKKAYTDLKFSAMSARALRRYPISSTRDEVPFSRVGNHRSPFGMGA